MSKQYIEIHLTSLAHDGRAVGRVHEALQSPVVVFVQGALPGQRVRAQITKAKKNFMEAICVEVLEQSADFIPAPCRHAAECGGCSLQTMPYDKQLFWKENMLREALQRIGKIAHVPFIKMHASPLLWAYRNKMEFAVGESIDAPHAKFILGLRAQGSHRIIPTLDCLLMPKDCQPILIKLQDLMRGTGFKPWRGADAHMQQRKHEADNGLWRHVVIRKPAYKGGGCHVQIITTPCSAYQREIVAKLGQELLDAGLGLSGFSHDERKSTSLYAIGERCIANLGQKYLQEVLAGVKYTLGHNSFFQINTFAAEHLCAEASDMAALSGGEILWDIYCGVGAPGLGLATHAKGLYGVESNAQAIYLAKKNAAHLGFEHCHYVAGLAEKIINNPKHVPWPKPDVVLLDPPRAGMHAQVVQEILKAKPERIIYISCNPATLARDVALLSAGYKLERVSAVDLFPHTAHVETCALLVRC